MGAILPAAGVFFIWLAYHGFVRLTYPSAARYPVRGVDVSHHQGAVDWATVRAEGMRFVYLKATEGATYRDSTFARNRDGARRAGLATGAYHYFTLCAPGELQARNFIEAAGAEAAMLPPAVDLEFGGNCPARPAPEAFREELRRFLAPVEQAFGRRAVLYVTSEFHRAYLADAPQPRPLWVRSIFHKPWISDDWVLWQYSGRGRLRGVDGYVDLNAFSGTPAEFARWAQAPPPTESRASP